MPKTDTKKRILEFITQKGRVRPNDLIEEFNLSGVMIHRHLRDLLEKGQIAKVGEAPLVFYAPIQQFLVGGDREILDKKTRDFLQARYVYLTAEGDLLSGADGFWRWAVATRQEKSFKSLAARYIKDRKTADKFYKNNSWINATRKIKTTFPKTVIDKVFYADFYSLPQFGKTKLGNLVLHSKLSQDKGLIAEAADQVAPVIKEIIAKYKVQAVGFIPHSIPRKIPFLKYLKKKLNLVLPEIDLVKAYSGEIPVAQKSLSRIEERVANARNTIFVRDSKVLYKRVLLIDDAVGSGATLSETAYKLKKNYGVAKVFGFALVGSYKGFEVIQEI